VVPRRSSPMTAARHHLLRRRRPRRWLQLHQAPSAAAWGPLTAARASGTAHGAQLCWGSPPSTSDGRPAAGDRRTPVNRGRRNHTEQGGGREDSGAHQDLPAGTTAGRPAGHRRRRRRRHRHRGPCNRHVRGGCGLGETLTAPPSSLLFVVVWAGWANLATRAVNRPAGPPAVDNGPQAALSSSASEVRRTPPELSKSPEKPPKLNFSPQAFILSIFRLISAVYLCFRPRIVL
jgi:hypothetical protein